MGTLCLSVSLLHVEVPAVTLLRFRYRYVTVQYNAPFLYLYMRLKSNFIHFIKTGVKLKTKLSLCLIKHHTMKKYGGVEV